MQTPFDFWNHWEKAYAHRLDWAYASRDRFLAEFDPAFRLALGDRQSAEAFAALYGDTQVGKTTLALKLMGIRPERFAELENILRAGRPRGQSSTATAIIYQRSADEHFRLITQAQSGDQPLDAAAFIQALQGMRQEIENHPDRRQTYRPGANFPLNISIKIPSVFFAESSDSTAINIVDLPGIGARSEAEHLKHILAHNLPLSTLIILVVKSENLTSLKYIQGDKIRHWRAMSQGFRIVTTHTLTNLKKHLPGFADKKALVDHVVQQCKASNEIGPDEELPRLYPLEYAESWERLVVQPSYERFQGILDELVN
ncbi:MAG: hypothetical protein ABIQ93_04010, partial [Saprospiraceae bacterium]